MESNLRVSAIFMSLVTLSVTVTVLAVASFFPSGGRFALLTCGAGACLAIVSLFRLVGGTR